MSPTLDKSSAIRRFEPSDAIEICNGMFFNFYTGLPQILLRHVFRVHHWVWRAIALNFRQGWGSYVLCKRWYAYEACMNPAPSGSLALQCVKLGNVLEVRNWIIFVFCLGLPHIEWYQVCITILWRSWCVIMQEALILKPSPSVLRWNCSRKFQAVCCLDVTIITLHCYNHLRLNSQASPRVCTCSNCGFLLYCW